MKGNDYLRPLTSKVKRSPFLTVDIESRKEECDEPGFTRPFLIGLYDGREYLSFRNSSKKEFWKEGQCADKCMRAILVSEHLGSLIYAHNGGRFDFLFFLPWLQNIGREIGFSFSIVPIQSSIQVLDVWKTDSPKKGRWRFLDSVRLLPMNLQSAAKTFGLSGKLENFSMLTTEHSKEWEKYNKIDCEQLYQVLLKYHSYIEESLGGEVGITSPSTSMKLFRRKYLKNNIERHSKHHEFVRKAYYGGRVEVFKKYGEGLKYYDINSSYPSVMKQVMPCGAENEFKGLPPARILDSERIGFVEALIDYPDVHIPVLPVRHEGKLVFPVGRLSGVWSWSEIRLAISQGAKVKAWGKSVWFEERLLFTEMVEELFAYRDKNRSEYDEGLSAVCKLLLNSLYGKFGMHTERVSIAIINKGDTVPDGGEPIGDVENGIYYVKEEVDAPYIIPQISAHITAMARIKLNKGMLDVQGQGYSVHYCDTDAIICDEECKFETSSALGGWKDEYPNVRLKAKFLGPKMYVLESMQQPASFSKVVAKGFGRENRTIETVNALQRGEQIYFDRLEKVGTLAKGGFKSGPKMVTTHKSLLGVTPKRVFKGNESSPIQLDMWE